MWGCAGAQVGPGRCLGVHAGMGGVCLCPDPEHGLCSMAPRLSACAELSVRSQGRGGPCLSAKSPVRVCTACPRQPELIIVVVTVSPLIPRIPLPPARRGLQINKSSLGAGASKYTYAPADGSTGTFARSWGRPGSPHRAPDLEAPTPGCQTTFPSSGSCGAEGWVRTVPWDGSSGRGRAAVCGTAHPGAVGK